MYIDLQYYVYRFTVYSYIHIIFMDILYIYNLSSKKIVPYSFQSAAAKCPTVFHDIVADKLHPSWMGTMDASRRAQDSSRVEKNLGH